MWTKWTCRLSGNRSRCLTTARTRVDYYKRPGKPAWFHPEIWNDAGTGDQIVPTLFQALMRGADGVGASGAIPTGHRFGGFPADPRLAYQGMTSVYRSLNGLLREYGPWLTTLRNNDRVAIVVSGRMMRTDAWGHVMGIYFARLLEAYCSCLHAHHPASLCLRRRPEAGRPEEVRGGARGRAAGRDGARLGRGP